MLLFFISTKD